MRAVFALAWLPAVVVGLRQFADSTAAADAKVRTNGSGSSQSRIGAHSGIELGAGVVLRGRYVLKERITKQSGPGKNFPKVLKSQFGGAKHLGTGGFGDAWKAHDSHLDKEVAVKIFYDRQSDEYLTWLSANALQEEKLRESADECLMVQEMMKSASKYPAGASRICQCYEEHVMDAVQTDKPVFLVLEMCGEELADVVHKMSKNGKTNVAQARWFMKQAIEGIAFIGMLSPPLIHHDLKPENLAVDGYNLKIIDWGAAVAADKPYEPATYTAIYAAPELFYSLKPVSFSLPAHSYDVYALGLIYMELLCPHANYMRWFDLNFEVPNELHEKNIAEMIYLCPDLGWDSTIKEDIKLIAKMVSWSPAGRPAPLKLLESPPLNTAEEPPPEKKGWFAGLR